AGMELHLVHEEAERALVRAQARATRERSQPAAAAAARPLRHWWQRKAARAEWAAMARQRGPAGEAQRAAGGLIDVLATSRAGGREDERQHRVHDQPRRGLAQGGHRCSAPPNTRWHPRGLTGGLAPASPGRRCSAWPRAR